VNDACFLIIQSRKRGEEGCAYIDSNHNVDRDALTHLGQSSLVSLVVEVEANSQNEHAMAEAQLSLKDDCSIWALGDHQSHVT
jgi:hypothetical protein